MRRIIVAAAAFALSVLSAFAQGGPGGGPGPGPVPSPWTLDGSSIYLTGQQCIVMPQSVTGGCKGNNTINAAGLFVNGSPVLTQATGASITIDTSAIIGGTTGRVLYDNAATVGEYATIPSSLLTGTYSGITGTGTLAAGATAAGFSVADASLSSNVPLKNGANIFTAAQTINLNALTPPSAQAGTLLQIGAADAAIARIELDSFANVGGLSCVRFDGTNLSRTALAQDDQICVLNGWGYDGTAISATSEVSIEMYAAQAWSVGAHGTYAQIATTANGSVTRTARARFENDGGITVPNTVTGGSKGAGTINMIGCYVSGIACLTGNQTITLSGDVSGSGTTAISTVLATVATAGTTGSSTAIPVVTIDVKGRTTTISTAVVIAPAGTLSGTTLNATVVTSSLTSVGTLVGGATGSGFTVALGTSTITGNLALGHGGTNNSLVASNGGIIYSDASGFQVLAGTVTASQCLLSGSSAAPTWGSCSGGAAVSSVSAGDTSLTISPTTGAVVAQVNLAATFAWTGPRTYTIASTIASSTGAALDDLKVAAATTTITGNTGSPITRLAKVGVYRPTITDGSVVTVTDAASFYVDNAPLAAGSVTITNAWAILVGSGATKLQGLTVAGTANFTSTFQISGNAMTFPGAAATITQTIASGAKAMATSAIASGACTSAQTDTATGAATTDAIAAVFSADPTATTGFSPTNLGMLTIVAYPTTNTVNFKECNNTAASITPGAHTINWRVTR